MVSMARAHLARAAERDAAYRQPPPTSSHAGRAGASGGGALALGLVALRPQRRLRAVGDADRLEDAPEVVLDRLLGDEQPLRDGLVGLALDEHVEDLLLAWREVRLVRRRGPAAGEHRA